MVPQPTTSNDIWLEATSDLATPSLVVDLDRVRRNATRLNTYAAEHGLRVRPHTKTHKSKRIAALQLESGAKGLTVAKVGEAEQFAAIESDILVAYPAADPARLERLSRLARDRTVRIAVDSAESIEAITAAARSGGAELGILVELDVGLHRVGVASPREALNLAQLVSRKPGVRLDGLFCYPGHIWGTPESQPPRLAAVGEQLSETLDLWSQSGLEASIVSGGSTPTAYRSHLCGPLTEIRPGTYIFNDSNTARGGYCEWDDCAARMLCTVVSTAVTDQVVIDAGTKALAADRCIPALESGFGFLPEYPDARVSALSEEHGQVDVSRCGRRPKFGERVVVIPNHICPCVNLQDGFWCIGSEDSKPERWPVDARGMLI